jgi:hypothetical protein
MGGDQLDSVTTMGMRSHRWAGGVALLALCLVLATTLQEYVGKPILYTDAYWESAQVLHQALLAGHPPEGTTWRELGANGTSHRVVVPLLAQSLSDLTGVELRRVYYGIDFTSLVALFALLFLYLRRWLPVGWSLVGILYLAGVLPTTYHFFYFHPWDRVSELVWLGALWGVRERRPLVLALVLAFGMLVKFDLLFVPLLYAAATWGEGTRRRTLLVTAGLLAATFGVLALATSLRPDAAGGGYLTHVHEVVAANVADARQSGWAYAPLLLLLLPAACGAAYRPTASDAHPRLLRWLAPFALLHLPLYALASMFREARAMVPLLLVLLPPALLWARARFERAQEGRSS